MLAVQELEILLKLLKDQYKPFEQVASAGFASPLSRFPRGQLVRVTPKLQRKPDYSARRGRGLESSCAVKGRLTLLEVDLQRKNAVKQRKNALKCDHVLRCNLACAVTWV